MADSKTVGIVSGLAFAKGVPKSQLPSLRSEYWQIESIELLSNISRLVEFWLAYVLDGCGRWNT